MWSPTPYSNFNFFQFFQTTNHSSLQLNQPLPNFNPQFTTFSKRFKIILPDLSPPITYALDAGKATYFFSAAKVFFRFSSAVIYILLGFDTGCGEAERSFYNYKIAGKLWNATHSNDQFYIVLASGRTFV